MIGYRCFALGLATSLGVLGCAVDDDADGGAAGSGGIRDDMPMDVPAGNCGEQTSGPDCDTDGDGAGVMSSTGAIDDDCVTLGCTGQGVCVADWDAEAQQRGPFECRFACVPELDDSAWCSDETACCDADAVCTERGYCVIAQVSGSSGETSTGGDSSSGGSDDSTGGE